MIPRKRLGLLVACLVAAGALQAQQIIENPDKPLSKNAGRVVVPKEVMAISDEGARDYYFKYPYDLQVAPDGSIFVEDVDQLLWFDKNGRFVMNLQKKGQGPGEILQLGDYAFAEKNIIVLALDPDRLLYFDSSGKFERETPLRNEGEFINSILLVLGGANYLHTSDWPRVTGEARYVDVGHSIKTEMEGKEGLIKHATFPVKTYAASVGGASGCLPIDNFIAAPYHNKYLVLSHTSEYLLKIYDVEASAVIRAFRRAYRHIEQVPVPEAKRTGVILNGKKFLKPNQKFKNDIADILVHNDEIWVVTSTRDMNKGVLVDVFDEKGAYTDCFYLKLPEQALRRLDVDVPRSYVVQGDFLYALEANEDETSVIKKYKIGS